MKLKVIIHFCVFFCATTTGLAQTNYTVISNLGQATGGPGSSAGVASFSTAAISFITGNSVSYLSSISVSMGASAPFYVPNAPINVSLYSDAGGSPGSSLAVLSGPSYPTNAAIYTYTNSSTLPLSANTTYWVVESTTSAGSYGWNAATSNAIDAGSIWTVGVTKSNFSNSGWAVQSGYYAKFSVVATLQPPALSIFQPIVLTYANPGFPFVLQQNSDLATTNWVAVTNAILSGVISNQTVFIVPPGGQQLFYRLH